MEIFNAMTRNTHKQKERDKDTDILVKANSHLEGDVIRAEKNLKMISVAFTGIDHVDLEACKERGILVSNSAGYSTPAVVELAFGLMISLLRNMVPLDQVTRNGGTMAGYSQRELRGRTIGAVGTGARGRGVAEVALAYGW